MFVYAIAFIIGLLLGKKYFYPSIFISFFTYAFFLGIGDQLVRAFTLIAKKDTSVKQNLALAPYMFFSLIITLLIRGEIVTYIMSFIYALL